MLSGRLKDKKIRSRSQQVKFFVQGHIKVRDRAEVRLQRSCPPQAAVGGAWPRENVEHQRTHRTSSESRAHTRTRQAFPHIQRLQELPTSLKKQASPVPPPLRCCCATSWGASLLHTPGPATSGLSENPPFQSRLLRVAKDMSPQGRPLDPKASQMPRTICWPARPGPTELWSLRQGLSPVANLLARPWLQGAWAFLREAAGHQGPAKDGTFCRKCCEDTEQNNMRGTERGHWRGRRVREDFSEEGTVELTGTGRKSIPGRKTINANCERLPG